MPKKRRPRGSGRSHRPNFPPQRQTAGPHGYYGSIFGQPSQPFPSFDPTFTLPTPPMPDFAQRRYCLFTFYDRPSAYASFQAQLSLQIEAYFNQTARPLPTINLELRGVSLSSLDQICAEEGCEDPELFLDCHLLEFYKVSPQDLVVALGTEAQQLLSRLKDRAADRSDHGQRFLTLSDVLSDDPQIPVESHAAHKHYLQAIIERIFAE